MRASLLATGIIRANPGSRRNALRLMDYFDKHPAVTPPAPLHGQPSRQNNESTWPDAWLINAVRRETPDEKALNALVDRYWKPLYARCRMLTLDGESARDLAQDTWLRVLRARLSLQPYGNFHAYIMTIATNLWRDANRAAVRAGPIADNRLASLDTSMVDDGSESIALGSFVADPHTLSADDQMLLEMDLDDALSRLEPRLRDVLVSRYIAGQSAAEIGDRYGRTEQAITGWIREAIRQMRTNLDEGNNLLRVQEGDR